MDKKDNPKALHTRKLKYSSEESEESEEEPQKRTKEPNLYKKVKVNSEGRFKKNVKPSEDKSRHREDKSASHSSKRPETRSNHHDRKPSKSDQSKDNKKKKPPTPEKKEKDKHDKKKEDLKKSKEKAEPEKSSKKEHSKEEPAKQKNRNKTASPPPPQKEKEASKKSVPPPKKHEKQGKDKETKEKDHHKQLKLDLLLEAKADKKNKTKTKAENESEKQFADFTKKYPQYVYKGRFKFPIDDKLFSLYNTLLQEYIPAIERPKPKTGFIPPQALGDILQIWNFFNSFPELFKCQDIQKEEIYASMKYDGEEPLLLLNDMHQGLLSLFTHEFIKKNRFDTYKDEVENPFFILIKHHVFDTPINGDEIAIIWTEFARKLAYLPPYTDFLTETTKMFFDTLAEKTCRYYNKLEYRMKPRILISIIETLYETDVFRDFLQAKMDATSILIKERNDLEQEIRQEELDQTNLKNKIKTAERGLKKEEQFRNSTLRLDSLRKQRDPEIAKKELEESKEELEKLEESLEKKQTRLEDVNSELCMTLQTATFIGSDAQKSEYWVFQAEPGRLYVRHPEMVSGEEKWFYYDKKSEIDQLIKSLNVKGIKEKKLHQDLQDLLKNGKIKFEEDEEDNNEEQKKQEDEKKKAGKKGGAAKGKEQNKMEEEKEKGDKNEEDEEEEDDYVVRKKEDPEASKKKMEEESEKVDKEEEEKKNEEAEKAKEQLKELEKEKQREKEALREKKKLEAEQQLTFEYWFAKIMEYEAPDINDDDEPEAVTARVTRRQHQQQQQQADQPTQTNQPRIKNPKELDIKTIKEMVNNTEKSFTIYLEKWEARWAHPKIKEELLEKLAKVEDIEEFADILVRLNDYFQVSEAPRGRRGRPQRDRSQLEGGENKEGEEEEEDDDEDVDDEDEEEEREEREREEYEREQEKQEARENRDDEWDSKRSSKSMEEENASENQSARLKNRDDEGGMEVEPEGNEQEDEVKITDNVSNNVTQSKEDREKSQKTQQMETEKAETAEVSEEQNKDNKAVAIEEIFDERENAKKVKKFPIKFWGAFNGRLKKAWVSFTSTVDNLAALYFSADLLCRAVDSYVEKKTARYFTLYKTGKEYMAAKRRAKQEAMAQKSDEVTTQPTTRYQNSEAITMETLDNYRHDKSRILTRGNRAAARESQSKTRSMAEAEADTIVGRLKERFRPPKSYREPSYEFKPKFDERAARVKLDELANLRRSVRLTTMSKKRYDNLNEQQWDSECKVCGKVDGQMVACSTCPDTYHLECAGIADLDVEREWTCATCLEKIALQRRTRSTTRKLQL